MAIPHISYLGFSAETGELSDNFDITKIETRNIYETPSDISKLAINNNRKLGAQAAYGKPSRSSGSEGGSWAWFVVKVMLFLLVCAGGYVGYTMYRTSTKKYSRFD